MDPSSVLSLFRQHGALLEGHFRLSSGLHSAGYLQSALVLQHPDRAATLGQALAAQLARHAPTVVLSPALGGLVIGHEVARALGARAIFAERHEGVMTLRRGFTIGAADRVAVIEDVVTTGKSTRETMAVVSGGAQVVCAGAIVDRSGGGVDLGIPLHTLAALTLATYAPEACPLCAAGVPVVKPGSRGETSPLT